MNITREKLSDLDLSIKVEIEENDYNEAVNKSLKRMQQNATVPGFRKGKAPIALISRMYRTSTVADEVQRLLSDSIFKYVEDEKLDIFGYPISND
nr:trigger factor family protein [Bacteroidales bacterium]